MAQSLKSLLTTLVEPDNNWKLMLLNNWKTIIGTMSEHVCIEKVHEDTVVLVVTDSCWLQEIYMLSQLILRKINQSLDQPRIKHLRFKQAGIRKKRVVPTQPQREKKYVSVALSPQERAALKKIDDPQLSAALEQFLIRCYQEKE
jgi:hypothetical protein